MTTVAMQRMAIAAFRRSILPPEPRAYARASAPSSARRVNTLTIARRYASLAWMSRSLVHRGRGRRARDVLLCRRFAGERRSTPSGAACVLRPSARCARLEDAALHLDHGGHTDDRIVRGTLMQLRVGGALTGVNCTPAMISSSCEVHREHALEEVARLDLAPAPRALDVNLGVDATIAAG